ncbi:MAG: hypothetical protein IPK26_20040 [Planctomycetes bacterium]|nr:hypothetical protein [Planctomycetota bacterium]
MRCLLLALVLVGAVVGQKPTVDRLVVDPFTGGDPVLMRAVGIEAYGPFPLADNHSTRDVDIELGQELRIRWAETRHFKIGISQSEREWPLDKDEKKALSAEIDALMAKLPKAKRPKTITSWLLVHLYAQRLEALYADFCKRTGFVDQAPPCKDGRGLDGRGFQERGGIGKGPYLGMHGKFCLLLLPRRSDLARYLRHWGKREAEEPQAHHFFESNSLIFVTTQDIRTEGLSTERALHCNIVYGMVRNFVGGYHGFAYDIPVWTSEGLGHWYRLRLDKKYNTIAGLAEAQWGLLHDADWAEKARARVESGAWATAAEMLTWQQNDCRDLHKHVMMWSRWDFLLSQGDEKVRRYLEVLKGLPTTGVPAQAVADQQALALKEAFGYDNAAFDAAWIAWVKANYKIRK